MTKSHRKQVELEERASVELLFSAKSASTSRPLGKCAFCGLTDQEVGMLYTCVSAQSVEVTVYFCLDCLREVAGEALSAEAVAT